MRLNTKTCYYKGVVLINFNVQYEWYNGEKKHDNKLNNHLLNIEKKVTIFFKKKIASILFVMHFCIIKCNFDVLNLFILITYDAQYVVIHVGSRWIKYLIFANNKWVAHILNAWFNVYRLWI